MAFIDEVRSELSNYLSGSDHADVCTFAYLRTLDIRLDQMKVLLEAMPTLTYCVTEDGFRFNALESNQAHEGRLHFLRKRLQLTNGDIKAMMKVCRDYWFLYDAVLHPLDLYSCILLVFVPFYYSDSFSSQIISFKK